MRVRRRGARRPPEPRGRRRAPCRRDSRRGSQERALPPRDIEVLHAGPAPEIRHPRQPPLRDVHVHCRDRVVPERPPGHRREARRADRRQGREGPGRSLPDEGRGPRVLPGGPSRAPRRGDRGKARGRGVLPAVHLRREDRRGHPSRAGSQAALRRRQGPQHGRHGLLLRCRPLSPLHAARGRGRGAGHHAEGGRGHPQGDGRLLQGHHVRRLHDHPRRRASRGIQRPIRGPRGDEHPASSEDRLRGDLPGRRERHARPSRRRVREEGHRVQVHRAEGLRPAQGPPRCEVDVGEDRRG